MIGGRHPPHPTLVHLGDSPVDERLIHTVELGSDNFGSFLSCLTCGYTINSRSIRSNGSIEEPMTLDAVVSIWQSANSLAHPFLKDDFVAQEAINLRTLYLVVVNHFRTLC